eukprot:COSAG02_NODE_23611_length_713_cov_0.995114_1_plen_171_part_10
MAAAPPSVLATAFLAAPSAVRPHRGVMRWSRHRRPTEPLQLWACEGCWQSVLVREALCELELEYILWPLGIPGKQEPKLLDPNPRPLPDANSTVKTKLVGHTFILEHLAAHYASGPRPGWLSLLATVPENNLGVAAEAEVWIARSLQRILRTIDASVRGKSKERTSRHKK